MTDSGRETRALAEERRDLVDLLPRFLTRALRGWNGITPVLESAGLDRPAAFLLRALIEERDAGGEMTEAEMRADLFNPYSTIRPIVDALPALVTGGYVARGGDRYAVTDAGRAVAARVKMARDDYLATLAPIPTADLMRLVDRLMEIAVRLWDAPEPVAKAHQARAWRAMPPDAAAPMVRLYGAVYALWMARDDSHNAAWRAAGFDGPVFDLLSHVWSGEATSLPALAEAVDQSQRPEDVTHGIERLMASGYLVQEGNALRLTPHGREARERIEVETDRRYFAPWPPLTPDDAAWLRATLAAVIAALPS